MSPSHAVAARVGEPLITSPMPATTIAATRMPMMSLACFLIAVACATARSKSDRLVRASPAERPSCLQPMRNSRRFLEVFVIEAVGVQRRLLDLAFTDEQDRPALDEVIERRKQLAEIAGVEQVDGDVADRRGGQPVRRGRPARPRPPAARPPAGRRGRRGPASGGCRSAPVRPATCPAVQRSRSAASAGSRQASTAPGKNAPRTASSATPARWASRSRTVHSGHAGTVVASAASSRSCASDRTRRRASS